MRALALALVLACLLAAACGGGDDDGDASVTLAATSSPRGSRTPAPGTAASPVANGSSGAPTGAPVPTPELEVVTVAATWQPRTANSIEELASASRAILVGKVVRLADQTSVAVGRSELPLSRFEVAVEHAIAGTGTGDTITVEQVGGVTTRDDGTQARIVLEGDETLQPGRTYLFFLSEKEDGALSSPPFARLLVGDDGTLQAPSDWATVPVINQLSGLTLQEAIDEISSSIN